MIVKHEVAHGQWYEHSPGQGQDMYMVMDMDMDMDMDIDMVMDINMNVNLETDIGMDMNKDMDLTMYLNENILRIADLEIFRPHFLAFWILIIGQQMRKFIESNTELTDYRMSDI